MSNEAKNDVLDSVHVIPELPDGRIIMLRELVFLTNNSASVFKVISGGVEGGEKPLDAAKRELDEEAQQLGGKLELLAECFIREDLRNGQDTTRAHMFVSTRSYEDSIPPARDPKENIEIVVITPEEALKQMLQETTPHMASLAMLFRYLFHRNFLTAH